MGMRKILLASATALAAMLLSFDGTSISVSDAQARIGRPLTPFSVAGVHRRVVRRHAFVAGAALGAPVGYGAEWGGGCSCAPSYGGAWGGGWGSGFGFRPGFGFGAPGFGWHRGWDRGWGW